MLTTSPSIGLKDIETQSVLKTIFISGSAAVYGDKNRYDARGFIHLLSKKIISEGFNIVNGAGKGVGSAIINGALEAISEKPEILSENQLIVKPFPLFETGNKKLEGIWEEYRQKMISMAGISIFIYGNMYDQIHNVIPAQGVKREFEIALEKGLILIPIASTGYIAFQIYEEISRSPKKYYPGNEWIIPFIKELASESYSHEMIIKNVMTIIRKLNDGEKGIF